MRAELSNMGWCNDSIIFYSDWNEDLYCYNGKAGLSENDSDQVAVVGAVLRPTEGLLVESGEGGRGGHGGVVQGLRQHPALLLHHDLGGRLCFRSRQCGLVDVLLVAGGDGEPAGVELRGGGDLAGVGRVALSPALLPTSSQLTCSVKLIP